ncbi:Uncharacterized conserved protein YndB, AHSA1/START domain [Collimonas sp. OK607]|uniref:SRPBCC family protein n=1 Tax=Collimonas sp. OK607 TaxID=1798194 RepID=UPI0008E22BCF|nr:SRPBCC family protein [Collimonas sp. OK607]SFA97610.1 Uncharacterized conserved protein YndB, AHSA1/START domain [Collimonas sp. OK607]
MDKNKSTDRIETEVVLKAARSRVWCAISHAEEFGDWFGVTLKGKTFTAGQTVRGQISHAGYEHLVWEVVIERMVPEELLSFRWHPYAIDTAVDYSQEPATLVAFELTAVEEGTLLRVVESGFDNIPAERRQEAFRMNSSGWEAQMKNIEKYVAAAVAS